MRDIEKAGQCHWETSLKHLGKARAVREVAGDSEKADMKLVFKKRRKEDLETYRLVSLTREGVTASHPAVISSAFEGQERDCRTLEGGKRRRCLYPDFSKAFDGVSHSLLIGSWTEKVECVVGRKLAKP